MEQLYRIHWKAKTTGKTGQGTMGFPKDEAQRYADAMNREDRGVIEHWIEPEASDERE